MILAKQLLINHFPQISFCCCFWVRCCFPEADTIPWTLAQSAAYTHPGAFSCIALLFFNSGYDLLDASCTKNTREGGNNYISTPTNCNQIAIGRHRLFYCFLFKLSSREKEGLLTYCFAWYNFLHQIVAYTCVWGETAFYFKLVKITKKAVLNALLSHF